MGFPITVDQMSTLLADLNKQAIAQQQIASTLSKLLEVMLVIAPHHLKITYTPNLRIGDHLVQITDIQSVSATVAEVDAVGNPVPIDPSNPPVWAVADPAIVSVTTNADGSATFKALGPLGTTQVSVTVGNLNAQDSITVVASAATTLSIKFGTPA